MIVLHLQDSLIFKLNLFQLLWFRDAATLRGVPQVPHPNDAVRPSSQYHGLVIKYASGESSHTLLLVRLRIQCHTNEAQ